jgi:hypothetical protein
VRTLNPRTIAAVLTPDSFSTNHIAHINTTHACKVYALWLRGPDLVDGVFAAQPQECVERAAIAATAELGDKSQVTFTKLEACPAITRVVLMTACGYWFILVM